MSPMTIHHLEGPLEQARGVIGRYPGPDEEYHFIFDSVRRRGIHMVGVRKPLEVQWWIDDECVRTEVLTPLTGHARYQANRIVERRP